MATTPSIASGRMAGGAQPSVYGSAVSIERALSRFGWLGDADDLLQKLGITRTSLRGIEHDDEVAAALDTRRAACNNTPWRIEHQQARVRNFLTEALKPHIDSIMATAWAALPYGYSVQEVVYLEPEHPMNPTPGKIGIAQVIECPFEWFMLRPDGALLWRDENQPADARRFVPTVHAGSLRKPHGEAILAKAYWPWFFRSHGWRMWAKFMERASQPLILGKTAGDKEALVGMLRTATSGPVMAVNDMDVVESVDTPGNSSNKFTEFEIACTRRIQRLILGQTLTSGTDGGSGNRALGEVHNEVRAEKRSSDIRMVTRTVQAIADRLCALNGVAPGKFVMEDGSGLEMERAKRDEILVKSGILRLTRPYLEEKYGFEPNDFEELDPVTSAAVADAGSTAGGGSTSVKGANMAAVNFIDGQHAERPRFTPGQQAIEDETMRTLGQLPSPIEGAAIASAIRHATSPDDLYDRLGAALADADDARFRQVFERALFAADLTGYGQMAKARPASEPSQQAMHAMQPTAAPVSVNLTVPVAEMNAMASEMMDGIRATAQQTFAQIREDVQNMPIVIPAPQVTVQNIVPEQAAPDINVTVQPAGVTVNNTHPTSAVQTVETDAQGNVTRTVTEYRSK